MGLKVSKSHFSLCVDQVVALSYFSSTMSAMPAAIVMIHDLKQDWKLIS
jgi:hypothetical protein